MTPTVLDINSQIVDQAPIASMFPWMNSAEYVTFMGAPAGREHYRLLAAISQQLPAGARVSDVGTGCGASALALAVNPHVAVTTYDVMDRIQKTDETKATPLDRPNIVQKIMPGSEDIAEISMSDVVLVDTDSPEPEFVKQLIENGFRGVLICDDIFLTREMIDFWNGIPESLKKINVSVLSHWSGTGCIVFDPSYIDIQYRAPYNEI